MRQVAVAVEPPQPIVAAWQPHHQERRKGGRRQQEEQADPMARPSGGSISQMPTQETARNSPTAVAIAASAGHSRSHRIDQRARVQGAGQQRVAIAGLEIVAALSIGRSVKSILPSRESAPTINHSMQYARRQRAKGRRPLINSAALPGPDKPRRPGRAPACLAKRPLKSQAFRPRELSRTNASWLLARASLAQVRSQWGEDSRPEGLSRAAPALVSLLSRCWAADSERASPAPCLPGIINLACLGYAAVDSNCFDGDPSFSPRWR